MSKLDELKLAFEHYRNVQNGNGSEFIKENGRNNRSPHCELIEAVYDVLYCDTEANAALTAAAEQLRESNAAMERLQAENELQRKCLNKVLLNVRNACTILGGEIFLAEFDKPRLYEPTLKVHDYLRKLVDDVDRMLQPEQQGGG